MKLGAITLAACLIAGQAFGLGCSRNRQEAVLKANEGDQRVKVDVQGAIGKYEEATKLDPTNHRIFFKLAMAYRKAEEWDRVASTLARASQLAPTHANYWFNQGYALEKQAEKKTISYEEAKAPYQKCIETDPNYDECYSQLGVAHLWTDDEQQALDNFTKAIEHAPTQIAYYAQLADLYIRLGYMSEAAQVLESAKKFATPKSPELFPIHVLLSQVHQERGDMTSMATELEAAKEVARPDGSEAVQILYNLGSTYAQLDPPRKQEAINMLKGFYLRACKSARAATYKTECETSTTLVTRLGGSLN